MRNSAFTNEDLWKYGAEIYGPITWRATFARIVLAVGAFLPIPLVVYRYGWAALIRFAMRGSLAARPLFRPSRTDVEWRNV